MENNNFAELVALLGGPLRVNELLGLKDKAAKDVRRAAAKNAPRAAWLPILKKQAVLVAAEYRRNAARLENLSRQG